MTTKREYDKVKLIILRAALIVIGAGVGATAVWQYFTYYPELVRGEIQVVIIVVSAAVLALILALSAKPFYRCGASIAAWFRGATAKLGGMGVAAIAIGLVAAGIAVLLVDVIMAKYAGIWAVRLLADVLVYIVFAALCCYGFTRWLAVPEEGVEDIDVKRGYMLAAECLTDERALTAVDTLIGVKVSDGAYKALCLFGGDADAIRRLDALVSCGAVELIKCKVQFGERDEYREYERQTAAKKRLKYVAPTDVLCDVTLSAFALPSDAVKEKYGNNE